MRKHTYLGGLLLVAALTGPACPAMASAQEPAVSLEKHNDWTVDLGNETKLTTPLYVTLKQVGLHWEIAGIYDTAPRIPLSEKLELFMASRDLQQWENAYTNRVINCDSFEAKQAEFHSVCSSTLSEKQSMGSATVGLFFGGSGARPVSYSRSSVTAAIQSIPVEQATAMLTAFEQKRS